MFVAALVLIAKITARLIAAGFVTTRLVPTGIALLRLRRRLATRRLDAAEGAAKFLDLALVGEFLALGNFDEFQNFVEMINHLLERLGNLRGVLDSLGDGRGFGGTEISGLDPRLGALRLGAAFLTAVIGATLAKLFTRRLDRADGFRFGRGDVFRRRFGFVMLHVLRLMRGKFRRRFRMGHAKTAGSFGLMLRVIAVIAVVGGFDGRSGGLNCFRRGRNVFGGGRVTGFWRGTRATAAATATAATATAVAGAAAGGGRVQIGLFVWHKLP